MCGEYQGSGVETKDFDSDSPAVSTTGSDSSLCNQVVLFYISNNEYAYGSTLYRPICYKWFILKNKDIMSQMWYSSTDLDSSYPLIASDPTTQTPVSQP